MSGKPAARVSDSVSKGVIVSGSATVLIGDAAEGKADRCPVCEPAVGAPVNPLLGVKLLPAETDFALPAPQPFVFARSYASNDMRVGVLGQGWSIPGEGVGLELSPAATVVIDGQGRRITFGALEPGEARFSPSERLWIRRGETASTPWEGRWAGVPEVLRRNSETVFVLAGGQYFHFAPVAGTYRLHTQFDRNHYATQFGWLPDGLLAVVRDSAGRHYRFAYRHFGNEVRLAGVALAVPGQPWQGLLDADEQADWLVRYQYSGKGELLAVFDRAGQPMRSFAWRHGRLVAHGRPDGLDVQYTWDAQGRVVQQREVDGLSRQYAYHADHTIVTDSLGRTETYHFEGEGPDTRWTAHTRADGSTVRFEYDGFGRRVASIDALERVTRERLDGQGRRVARILPDGSAWRYRLDEDSGEVLAIEGPEGLAWHIERDERANPLVVRGPGGHETRYRYEDPRLPDRPTSIISDGRERRLAWNALGQLTTHTDCSGHTTRFSHDAEGRLVSQTNALGETTAYAYDSIGRLIVQTDAARQSTRYSYDALGRLIALERPDGKVERLAWDRFGRLTAFMDAGGLTQRYRYDEAGRLIEFQNENDAVSGFAYDVLDRLVAETGFDGRTQRYRYNLAGELVARCEVSLPGEPVTTYEHDKAGRLTRRHLPATAYAPATTETFHWRADGQLAGFDSPTVQVRLSFDAAGRLNQETQTHGDDWRYACVHRFDAAGRPHATTLGTAPVIEWLTYGPGHLHGIRLAEWGLDIERDALHREIERKARAESGTASIFTEARRYTERGQLKASRFAPALGTPWERTYQYDALGFLVDLHDNTSGPIAYAYDASGRLTASRHRHLEHHYRFDPAGNRLDAEHESRRRPSGEEWARIVRERIHDPGFNPLMEFGPDASGPSRCLDNRIHSLAGTRNRHDGAGNLIEQLRADGTHLELGYDGAHRLVQLKRSDADGTITTVGYAYDALSRRIAKTVTSPDGTTATTRYGWDGERLVCEDDGERTLTVLYEPGSFVPVLRIEQGRGESADEDEAATQAALDQVVRLCAAEGIELPKALQPQASTRISLYVTDHLGTPLRLVGQEGAIEWQARPDDWGAVREQHGIRQPIRFQGQWEDEESGFYYNRYRYYDPAMGRYVTQDPIGLEGGSNVFSYPYNPTSSIDPLGLQSYMCRNAGLGAWCQAGDASKTSFTDKVKDWLKKEWDAVPKTKCEWSKYLSQQSELFSAAAYGSLIWTVTAPAAPVLQGVSSVAGVGSEVLKGRPEIATVNVVFDAAGTVSPGGVVKDIALDGYKTVIGNVYHDQGSCEK